MAFLLLLMEDEKFKLELLQLEAELALITLEEIYDKHVGELLDELVQRRYSAAKRDGQVDEKKGLSSTRSESFSTLRNFAIDK